MQRNPRPRPAKPRPVRISSAPRRRPSRAAADARHALNERIRLLEAVVDNFPGGISVYDEDLRMVLCNEQQKTLLEYPESLFAHGYPTLEEIYRFNAERGEYGPGEVEAHVSARMALARQNKSHVFERTRPNGRILEVRGVPLEGGGFVTTYLDMTEQRRNQALVAHLAHHDPLTDLPNRLLLRDRLRQAMARVARGEIVALLYLDLDGFKQINDRHGHGTGDHLLKKVAKRLNDAKRDTDTLARLGGDEFVLVQTGLREPADAAILAQRLIQTISAPYELAGHSLKIGMSIGIAVAPLDGATPDDLLRNADVALYRCKENGRGRFMYFGTP